MLMELGLCISEIAAKTKYYNNSLTAHVTTRAYRAPEIMLIEDYHFSADIWSCAVILG